MKKKFLIGLSAAAVAATFLGCGEGDVYELTNADMAIQFTYVDAEDSALYSLMNNAIKDCSGDPACAAKMGSTPQKPEDKPVASSSSIEPAPISNNSGFSSSSSKPTLTSSASGPVFNPTSSSEDDTPQNIPTGEFKLGTCAPSKNVITKGESVEWTFNLSKENTAGVSGMDILDATFTWNFGTMGVAASPSSAQKSGMVSYPNSGTATAKVMASFKGGLIAEEITCSSLQVNGAAITGCKCTAAAPTVDVSAGGVATWTVDGCASVDAKVVGFEWPTGMTGTGATGTKTFTAKGDEYAPTVVVSNDDNTRQSFTCDAVKPIDSSSPDYMLDDQNKDIELPAGSSTLVMNLPDNWHNGTAGTCTFSCTDLTGAGSGTVDGVKMMGANYMTASIPIASTIGGNAIAVELSVAMTCKVGW
ncbi:MAG: hypothetical protein HUK20_05175 [Fibrobacter sp.]|nr:hypothetical protein [Fibrobacter sp.]